jgi:hypothetical protein
MNPTLHASQFSFSKIYLVEQDEGVREGKEWEEGREGERAYFHAPFEADHYWFTC